MKRVFAVVLVALCGLFMVGCELDSGENFHFVSLEVTNVDIPEHFVFNQSHTMEVTFSRPDNCTFFQGFNVSPEMDGVWTIVAVGSVLLDEDCSPSDESLTGNLTVNAIRTASYTLRFYAGEDSDGEATYLEYEVPVIEEN